MMAQQKSIFKTDSVLVSDLKKFIESDSGGHKALGEEMKQLKFMNDLSSAYENSKLKNETQNAMPIYKPKGEYKMRVFTVDTLQTYYLRRRSRRSSHTKFSKYRHSSRSRFYRRFK